MRRSFLPTLPVAPVSGTPTGGTTPVVPVAPVTPVAPVAPWLVCGADAEPPVAGPAAPCREAALEPAGLQREGSVEPLGQTEGSYGGVAMGWLIPGWFGPSHATQSCICL